MACDVCANGNLDPTPSPFQFDFLCNGKLATAPSSFVGTPADDAPSGCAFNCADKMSVAVCKAGAENGGCKKNAKTMRFACAATCGICGGIGMPVGSTTSPLPKCAKGDKDEGDSCEAWAEQGECVGNYGYMKESCPRACGLCADDGQSKVGAAC